MPKKLLLEEIEPQLPNFVKPIPESYRGARYPMKFIDIEYNEIFEAIPGSVIKLQHGCKTRSNVNRSKATKGRPKGMVPLADIKAKLPPYLEIIDSTYKGIRNPAEFYNKQYNVKFVGLVCNVLRNGKGYCPERKLVEFSKSITIPADEIQIRLDKIYNGKFTLIKETYKGTNEIASFKLPNGEIRRYTVFMLLEDKSQSNRPAYYKWRKQILIRDNNKCQVCGSVEKIEPHHLYSWVAYPALRFDLGNGIALCRSEHQEFHAKYGQGDNTLEQFLDWLKQKGQTLSSLARDLEARLSKQS